MIIICYYITASLPKEANLENLRPLLEKFNMDFTLISNLNIKTQLRPNELYFRATKSHCDCGSVLGSNNRSQEYEKLIKSKKVKALRKKRWSDEQIHSWIMEKISSKPQKINQKKTPEEIDQEINKWINFIKEILKNVKPIGILKHWYKFGLDNEKIELTRTTHINLKDLNSNMLLNLEEDVLYEIMSYSKH